MVIYELLKRLLYFRVASYFRFFAAIKLSRWKPRVVVITGSSGKTTLLHLVESQIGDRARYSHHANSSYGIPFDILGLKRSTLLPYEWVGLFLLAPLKVFSKTPIEKLYIVEADCDRPGEGKFLSTLLKPEVTIWLSSSRTHSMNFDKPVEQKLFDSVDDAIAYEYGYFLEATNKLVIFDSDSQVIKKQLSRTKTEKVGISSKSRQNYEVSKEGTMFKVDNKVYRFKYLLPEAVFSSIAATLKLSEYLKLPIDDTFSAFKIPPGRSSIFQGIRKIIIIDSCYNANFSSAAEIINMFTRIQAEKKWAVIGDMLEQGKSEKEEHEKLARLVAEASYDRVVLIGPRIIKHGLPILEKYYKDRVVGFENPKDVLDYLLKNLESGETILFKGARFLEGVIEHLLADKEDVKKLSRREKIWEKRRKKWGL